MKEESYIERLLRQVYSCDTEAGDRLRYHYTKAVACPEYCSKFGYCSGNSWELPSQKAFAFQDLLGFCIFKNTKEGHTYWYNIVNMLQKKEEGKTCRLWK